MSIGLRAAASRRSLPSRAIALVLVCLATTACASSVGPTRGAEVAVAAATPRPDDDSGVVVEEFPIAVTRNEVRLENREDLRFKARASIKLHRFVGDRVDPVNIAFAQGGCTDCQTFAVAVQVALYARGATSIQAESSAAVNGGCVRCTTVAKAIQYVIPLDDPSVIPFAVDRLVKDLERELRFLASVRTWDQMSGDQALGRIQKVLDRYPDLRPYLNDSTQTQLP